jgi:hypothetical protein
MRETAREHKVVTRMGSQGTAHDGFCTGVEPTTKRPAKVDQNATTGEELRQRHAEHFQKMDEHIRELNQRSGRAPQPIAAGTGMGTPWLNIR